MLPDLLIFNKAFTWYSLTALFGLLFTGFLACRDFRKRHLDDNEVIFLSLWSLLGVFIGSHILYALVNFDSLLYLYNNISNIRTTQILISAFISIFGGSVFYGGLLGGLFVTNIYLKKMHLDKTLFIGLLTPYIPLFHFFGRIGCFLSGCCYGIPSPTGVHYMHSVSPGANGITRFPVQLLEASINLLLFFFLLKLRKNDFFFKHLLTIYLLLYAIIRFFLEFLRGDVYRGMLNGISTSQIISILLILTIFFITIKNKTYLYFFHKN